MVRSRNLFPRLLLVIVLALFIGALVPSVTLAAGPSQSTEPGDLSTVVSGFLDLLIALAIGGGIAYLLQMIGPWRDWSSPLKPLIVILLTAILGGALTSLKVLATAELFAQAPEWGRAFISFIVVFVGSQLTYQKGFSPSFVMPAAVFDTKGK